MYGRPTHEWIRGVDLRQKQLASLELSREQTERLKRWQEIEFICSALSLEGRPVSREQVGGLVRSASSPEPSRSTVEDRAILDALSSLRRLESLIQDKCKDAELSPELLIDLSSSSTRGFRTTEDRPGLLTHPVDPAQLAAAVERACRWFAAESFVELHPVEQASIVLLRFIELRPFEEANERTALLAASLFTLRNGLPPLIIVPELESQYRAALREGFQMNTKPMVEVVAEAVSRALDAMINNAG